jgi:hypothetical protein
MHGIPGDSFDSSNGGLIETFDTEGGNFLKGGATVLESINTVSRLSSRMSSHKSGTGGDEAFPT